MDEALRYLPGFYQQLKTSIRRMLVCLFGLLSVLCSCRFSCAAGYDALLRAGVSLIILRMSSITLTTLWLAFMLFSTFSMELITVV